MLIQENFPEIKKKRCMKLYISNMLKDHRVFLVYRTRMTTKVNLIKLLNLKKNKKQKNSWARGKKKKKK